MRAENQDGYDIGYRFYLICDGMDGEICGAFASQLVVDIILRLIKTVTMEQV